MQIEFQFGLGKSRQSSTGLQSDSFNEDLSFHFSAKKVHVTDPKEIQEVLRQLDLAVAKYKKDLVEAHK